MSVDTETRMKAEGNQWKQREKGDILYKAIIIGDSEVGKTCLLHRFSDDKWEPSYIATVGVDCKWRVFNIDGERVKLEVWDTAGQERFRAISAAYFCNVDGVIFAYRINNKASFAAVEGWMQHCDDNIAGNPVTKMLIACQVDRSDEREVTLAEGRKCAEKFGIKFMETSSKDGYNVMQLFELIGREIKKRKDAEAEAEAAKRVTAAAASPEVPPEVAAPAPEPVVATVKLDEPAPENKDGSGSCC